MYAVRQKPHSSRPGRERAIGPGVTALPGRSAPRTLSLAQARRIALAAQGFAEPRPAVGAVRAPPAAGHRPGRPSCRSTASTCWPAATTCRSSPGSGPTTAALLDRARDRRAATAGRVLGARGQPRAARPPGRCCASGCGRRARRPGAACAGSPDEQPELVAVGARRGRGRRGPMTARAGRGRPRARPAARDATDWGWNWSDVKIALEYLFWAGQISSAGRDRAVRAPVRRAGAGAAAGLPCRGARPEPRPREPRTRSASSMRSPPGPTASATEQCPARLLPALARATPAPAHRRAWSPTGELRPVDGRGAGAGRPTCTATPGARGGCTPEALLSPFDSLVWQRDRTERPVRLPLPASRSTSRRAQRVHGYYVLPFLLGDGPRRPGRPQGRPRGRRRCACAGAPGSPAGAARRTAPSWTAELATLAGWLGLGDGALVRLSAVSDQCSASTAARRAGRRRPARGPRP